MTRKRASPASSNASPITHAADGSDELAAYLEYNRILRSWFVAFGIGGPALFLIEEQIWQRLIENGELRQVSAAFIVGAAAQVMGAVINKIANWYVYLGATDAAFRTKRRCRVCGWLVRQFWVDMVLDALTIAAYGWATWHLFTVFGAS